MLLYEQTGAQILLAYDNLMHYVLYTNPLGGGDASSTSGRADEQAPRSSMDVVHAKFGDKIHRVEQSIDDVRPEVRRLLDGL